jgi:hypothetical protein
MDRGTLKRLKTARILLANLQTLVFIGGNRLSGQEDFGGD